MNIKTITLREKLHQFINYADESKLQELYVLFEKEMESVESNEFKLTNLEIENLDKQRENYLSGNSKTYSWGEVEKELMINIKK